MGEPSTVELVNKGITEILVPATDACSLLVGTAVTSPNMEVVPAEDRGSRSEVIADGSILVGNPGTVLVVWVMAVGRSSISLALVVKTKRLELV